MSNVTPILVTGTLSPSGTQNVSIVSSITLAISAASLPLPTGAATEATLAAIRTDTDKLTFASTRLLVDGSGVTQPISGSVSVSNFPATQPVSGTVAVSNFPATQPISGTVAVSGNVTVVQPTGSNLNVAVSSQPALPNTLAVGQTKIAVTGTAVQLASNALINGVVLTANLSNAASITVGTSSVNNTTNGTGNGYVLAPGAAVGIAILNTNDIWINGTSGDVCSFIGT